ncbi:MAG: hypothetical protein QNK04_32230 [Myxococcota bacterium]|nr:hypothetical protein [Myxococcota bacterium]
MAAGRNHLEVVQGGASSAEESAPVPPGSHGTRWAVVLGILLLMALLGLGIQSQRVARLAGEVEGLRAELAGVETELVEAQGQVEAHRQHLDEVRGAVDRLQQLVSRPPVPAGEPL